MWARAGQKAACGGRLFRMFLKRFPLRLDTDHTGQAAEGARKGEFIHMEKKIVIGSDISGFTLKEAVAEHLKKLGYEVMDVGTLREDAPVDYWTVGFNVGGAVSRKEFERGIVICGTGQGVSIAANKFPGVICGLCESVYAVNRARTFNNINVLGLGGFLQAPVLGIEMVDAFLNTQWKQGMDESTAKLLEKAYAAMQGHDREVFK